MIKVNRKTVLTDITAVLILILFFSIICPSTHAQTATTLTPADEFNIPATNGSISFAVNGSYLNAEFRDNSWTFYNLNLNGSQGTGNLSVSLENCSITIRTYSTYNYTDINTRIGWLVYDIQGHGTQTINLGLNTTQPSEPFQWTVVTGHNYFLVAGDDWTLMPNGTLTIKDATNNASISRYGFTVDRGQHSVTVTIGIVTVCTVAAAATIALVNRKRSSDKNAV